MARKSLMASHTTVRETESLLLFRFPETATEDGRLRCIPCLLFLNDRDLSLNPNLLLLLLLSAILLLKDHAVAMVTTM